MRARVEGALDDGYAARAARRFEGEHRRRYGFDLDAPIEIATLRVVGRGVTRDIELRDRQPARRDAEDARSTATSRCTSTASRHDPDLRPRRSSRPGHRIAGPAIVEQEDTHDRHRTGLRRHRRRVRQHHHPEARATDERHATETTGLPGLRARARHRPGHARHHREHALATPATRWTACSRRPRSARSSASSPTSSR